MTRKRIILTGASGTLGHNLAVQLADNSNISILCLHRDRPLRRILPPGVTHTSVDFHNKMDLRRIVEQFHPDSIIHCAASGTQLPKPDWFDLVRFNVDVPLNLCECASIIANCNFIYVSTGLAYRDLSRPLTENDPLDTLHPYGASKAAADILVRSAAAEFGVPLTVVRPFSFTGPSDDGSRLFPSLLRAAVSQKPFDLSPGDQIRDHCAVQDIASGIIASIFLSEHSPQSLNIFNLGSGCTKPLKVLIRDILTELGLDVQLNFGARSYARFEPHFMVADNTHSREVLSWRPKTNLAYAVWQLAQESFPTLTLRKPHESLLL